MRETVLFVALQARELASVPRSRRSERLNSGRECEAMKAVMIPDPVPSSRMIGVGEVDGNRSVRNAASEVRVSRIRKESEEGS